MDIRKQSKSTATVAGSTASAAPAKTQPAAQMSTADEYSVLPNRSSGARYHLANTWSAKVTVWGTPVGQMPSGKHPLLECSVSDSLFVWHALAHRKYSDTLCWRCHAATTAGHAPAPTWFVYFRSGLPKMRDRPKSASFSVPARAKTGDSLVKDELS